MSDNASAVILCVAAGATIAVYFIAAAWRDRGIAQAQARAATQPGTGPDEGLRGGERA